MNIDPDFIIKTPKGYYCAAGDFYLDPRQSVNTAIVSHAHGDHACAGSENVYCTQATAGLMQLRLDEKAAKTFHIYNTDTTFNIAGVAVSFHHAGHILGSVQVLMKYNDVKYLYTGDFKLQKDPTTSPISFTQADVLITETTFAHPQYTHPEPIAAMKELLGKGYAKITVGAYALGKAQHITALLQHQQEYMVFIHPKIVAIHHLYERQGVALGAWKPFNSNDFKQAGKAVFIVPPAIYRRMSRRYTDAAVFATGWKSKGSSNNNLQISDHADWLQLMTYIQQVQPKLIYTIHGDGSYLAEHLESSSVKVLQLPVKNKRII